MGFCFVVPIGSTSRRPKPMIYILDIAIKTCCEAISLPKLVMKLYKPATIMTAIKLIHKWHA